MGITTNRMYNDPSLGAAFGNLAQAFMPPSSSDLAGYATAGATREQAARLAWLFNNPLDPTASERSSLTGVQGFGQTPDGFGMTDATNRRGQDVSAKSALDVAGVNNAGAMARQLAEPVKVGQGETAFLPDQTATATGLPGMFTGAVNVGQGDTTYLPNGQKLDGAKKPLTEEEMKGAILGGLPAADQRNSVMGSVPVETIVRDGKPVVVSRPDAVGQQPAAAGAPVQVVGPGGTPILMDPAAAAAMGATPYDPKAGAVDVKNYVTKDGRTGSVAIAQDGTMRDAMTGDALPEGTRTFTGSLTGSAQDTGLGGKSTEASDKAGIFYSRAAPASANLDAAIKSGYTPTDADYEGLLGALSGLPNAATRHLVSDAGRAFYGNAQNFMMAILRPDTGAAFGKEEFQTYARVFIPMPGDDQQTLQNKSVARATALSALQGTSRGSAEAIAAIMQQNGLPIPPEMQAVMARNAANGGAQPDASAGPAGNLNAPAPGQFPTPPQGAINMLKGDPNLAAAFDQKYGAGAAAAVLGGN